MSARYGDRTEIGNAVTNWGRGGGGAALGEVTMSISPAPSGTITTVTEDGNEFLVAKIIATSTLTIACPDNAIADVVLAQGGGGGNNQLAGGGGGGGFVVMGTIGVTSAAYPIVIGAGGALGDPSPSGNATTGFGASASGTNGTTSIPAGPIRISDGGDSGIAPAPADFNVSPITHAGGNYGSAPYGIGTGARGGGGGAGASASGTNGKGFNGNPGNYASCSIGGVGGPGIELVWLPSQETFGGGGGANRYSSPGSRGGPGEGTHGGSNGQGGNAVANRAGGGGGGPVGGNGGSGVAYVRMRRFQV